MAETQAQDQGHDKPTTGNADPGHVKQAVSPTTSDKTVVASEQQCSVEPYRGGAIFSTDGGKRPPRNVCGPPYPPVIVRSDKVFGVWVYANYWRVKLPRYYHHFFPGYGWTINDLWDAADIHLESPGFLAEVLYFLTRDNVVRAQQYAFEWSKKHPEKLDMLGSDIVGSGLYDVNEPLTIVDKVFTDGELDKEFPKCFFWHVLNIMRSSMHIVVNQQQAVKASAKPHGTHKDANEDANSKPGSSPAPGKLHANANVTQPLPAPMSGAGMSETDQQTPPPELTVSAEVVPGAPTRAFTPTAASAGLALPSSGTPLTRAPSLVKSHPPRNYTQLAGLPLGDPIAMTPLHTDGQIRYAKTRPSRSTSGSYDMAPLARGWVDNSRLPSDSRIRQPSGPMPPAQESRYPSAMMAPMVGQGLMSPPNPAGQFPPYFPLTSPPMHPAQLAYPPMMPPGMLPQQHPRYGTQFMDPTLQHFGPVGHGPRGAPFGDMTNNINYPPMRGMNSRGSMGPRGSHTAKAAGLYNPYGAERPDKADFAAIPLQANGRKGSRNSFSNNPGRGRRPSTSRVGYGGLHFEQDDNTRNSGHYTDIPTTRTTYSRIRQDVINDKDFGCDSKWIGPKNTEVCELFVAQLPPNVTKDELRDFFQSQGEVKVTEITLKYSAETRHILHAFVHFATSAHAREGLKADGSSLRGKSVVVNVPNRYFKIPDGPLSMRDPRTPAHFASGHRVSSYGGYRPVYNDRAPSTSVRYSPQDARSDLRRVGQEQQQQDQVNQGSPEPRKLTAQPSPASSTVGEPKKGPSADDLGEPVDKLESLPTQIVATMDTETAEESSQTADKQAKAKRDSVTSDNATGKLAAETTVGEDKAVIGVSNQGEKVHDAPLDVTQTIPAEPKSPFVKPVATVVIPPPINNSVEAAESTCETDVKTPIEIDQMNHSQEMEIKAPPRTSDETTSDDEQKNDQSFHSAQESQSDTGEQEQKEGSVAPLKRTPAASVSTVLEPPHAETSEVVLNSADGVAEPCDKKSLQETRKNGSFSTSEKLYSDIIKKQGAKQTESLCPFAKPSKSQMKKERQTKKKDKRKGKEKTKVEKTPVPTESAQTVSVQSTDASLEVDGQSELPTTETISKPELIEHGGSGKEKAAQSVLSSQMSKLAQEEDNAQNPMMSLEAKESHLQYAGGISVSSADKVLATDLSQSNLLSVSLINSKDVEEPARTKMSKDRVAVPSLDLLKRKASPKGATFSLETTVPSKTELSKGTPVVGPGLGTTTASMASPDTTLDTASIASSSTLREPSPPLMSTSPTAADFFTPLQTPVTVAPPQLELAKKKKGKKKKKSAPKPANIPEDAHVTDEPFFNQLSEIEDFKSGKVQSNGYYNQESEQLRHIDQKEPKSVMEQIQAYVIEKTQAYARQSDKDWVVKSRRGAEKASAEEIENLIANGRPDVTALEAMLGPVSPTLANGTRLGASDMGLLSP